MIPAPPPIEIAARTGHEPFARELPAVNVFSDEYDL